VKLGYLKVRAHDVISPLLVPGCMQVRIVAHDGANEVKLVSCPFFC
jgi:hypothetical protein